MHTCIYWGSASQGCDIVPFFGTILVNVQSVIGILGSEGLGLIIAIIISVFGTLGDLIESKFKREYNVKDSGVIIPGHGGMLDRLDSIIFASPYIYLFLKLI